MKSKFFILVLISTLFFYGCSYYYEEKEEYLCYYDKEQRKIKIKGEMEKGNQNGEWKYFDTNGIVVQQGIYQNGLFSGNWEYNYDSMNCTINWKILSINNFKFSLPNSFYLYNINKQNSSFMYLDSLSKDLLSIAYIKIKEEKDIEEYLFKTINEYKQQCLVLSDSLLKIKTDESFFLFL